MNFQEIYEAIEELELNGDEQFPLPEKLKDQIVKEHGEHVLKMFHMFFEYEIGLPDVIIPTLEFLSQTHRSKHGQL